MSDGSEDLNDWRAALNHPAMVVALRVAKLVLLGVMLFAFSFTEIVAELLAPIVLVCGIGWGALPRILSMVESEGQQREMLSGLANAIPKEFQFAGLSFTPTMLILDGLLLIAVAALCRTFETIVSSEV